MNLNLDEKMNLSDEAIGALMMCLQKCLLEQRDVTDLLRNLKFVSAKGELFVLNPPIVKFDVEEIPETEQELATDV